MADEKQTTPPIPAKPTMLVCDCVLAISKNSDVPLRDVTPAEMLLLVAMHNPRVGANPISGITNKRTVTRDVTTEIARLGTKYASKKIKAVFQGAIPALPASFEEAQQVGMGAVIPVTRLVDGDK